MEIPYAMNLTLSQSELASSEKKTTKKRRPRSCMTTNSDTDDDTDDDDTNDDDTDDSGILNYESPPSSPSNSQSPTHNPTTTTRRKRTRTTTTTTTPKETLRPGDVIAYQNTILAVAGSAQGRGQAVVLATRPDHPDYPLILHNGVLLPASTPIQRIAEFRRGVLYRHAGHIKSIHQFRMKNHQQQAWASQNINMATGLLQQADQFKQQKHHLQQQAVSFLRGDQNYQKQLKETITDVVPSPQRHHHEKNVNNNNNKPLASDSSSTSSSSSTSFSITSVAKPNPLVSLKRRPNIPSSTSSSLPPPSNHSNNVLVNRSLRHRPETITRTDGKSVLLNGQDFSDFAASSSLSPTKPDSSTHNKIKSKQTSTATTKLLKKKSRNNSSYHRYYETEEEIHELINTQQRKGTIQHIKYISKVSSKVAVDLVEVFETDPSCPRHGDPINWRKTNKPQFYHQACCTRPSYRRRHSIKVCQDRTQKVGAMVGGGWDTDSSSHNGETTTKDDNDDNNMTGSINNNKESSTSKRYKLMLSSPSRRSNLHAKDIKDETMPMVHQPMKNHDQNEQEKSWTFSAVRSGKKRVTRHDEYSSSSSNDDSSGSSFHHTQARQRKMRQGDRKKEKRNNSLVFQLTKQNHDGRNSGNKDLTNLLSTGNMMEPPLDSPLEKYTRTAHGPSLRRYYYQPLTMVDLNKKKRIGTQSPDR
jgi:hypothetical protein